MANARRLYEDFTGHEADEIVKVTRKPIDTGALIGHVEGIAYETVRDGKREKYFHKFKKRARPMLVASHNGEQIELTGGDYTFTDRGIVDN